MEVTSEPAGLTYKRAQTAEERRRIRHEAAVLRQVAHPGIVQLLNVEGGDLVEGLVLRTVSGGDLTALGQEPMPVIAGLGAALATTVADLHALGFSHGGIEASHVLLDEAGRPVLCSLGRAKATAAHPNAPRLHDDDLQALAVMLLELLPPDASIRVARMLRGLAMPSRRRPRRDASWLARHLMSMVPDARLPGAGRTSPTVPASASASGSGPGSVSGSGSDDDGGRVRPSGSLRRGRLVPLGRLVGIGTGFCLLVAGGIALAECSGASVPRHRDAASLSSPGRPTSGNAAAIPSPRQAASRPPDPGAASGTPLSITLGEAATPCPVADDHCVPIPLPGGILLGPAGRYSLGQPGDVVVMGRWRCGPTAFPAVLRPGTGDIWAFASWPTPGHPVASRLVGHAAWGWRLRVLPGASGCDGLEVDRRNLPPLTIPVVAR